MLPTSLAPRSGQGLRTRIRVLAFDLCQVAVHGHRAPRRFELIHLDPRACRTALVRGLPTTVSGRVLDGDWDLQTRPLHQVTHIRIALARWRDGLSWQQAGAYDNMLGLIDRRGGSHQGASTFEEVVRRYERLDAAFERVRDEGRLRTRRELSSAAVREQGGVLIHVGRDGQPIYNGWSGCHRIAMALALDLPVMPAMLGAVHPQALRTWRTHLRAAARLRLG